MSHIEILLPLALPPTNNGQTLLNKLRLPALATLVSRHRQTLQQAEFAPSARALPHEAWLAHQFGLTETLTPENSPPFACAEMYWLGTGQQKGVWFILHPAHFQIGQDHMIMADHRTLELSETESRALFEAAQTAFLEAGKTLIYGNAMTWFVRADDWENLITASPDMACGRNLRYWMPEGEGEGAWRKLLNDIQMIWHAHPLNAAREARGAQRINALWLWGGASRALPHSPATLPYTHTYRFAGRMEAYGQFFPEQLPNCQCDAILRHPPESGLVFLDDLMAPALAGDWARWLSVYETLEKEWFVPLLDAFRSRTIRRLSLHLSNDSSLKTFVTDAASQRKFWIRQSLAPLLR